MKNFDAVDGMIGAIAIVSLIGLIWGNLAPSTETTITQVMWAALVGLGLKKAPSTLNSK